MTKFKKIIRNSVLVLISTFVLNTQALATDAQCFQAIDLYDKSYNELKFIIDKRLMSQVSLANMNVVSSWEMAYKYCISTPEGLKYLDSEASFINKLRNLR